ncbi:MAG: dihydrolipoyl dehydrogenase family protein [Acidimicrobiales bacterium]
MPATKQVDAIVLGLGPGGEDVAGRLAQAGLSVVAVDERLVGGECPYWGCIPSKAMVRSAGLLAEARRVPGMAGTIDAVADWRPVAARVRELTDTWDDTVAVERLEGMGATFVRGRGRLASPDTVTVGDRRFRAGRAVVVATGAAASVPPVPGLAATPYWTNRAAIECAVLPASLVVLGGGAVGLELAQVFARFGVTVSVVELAPRLLATEEPEVSSLVADALVADGTTVHAGVSVSSVAHGAGGFTLDLGPGGEVTGEGLLVATGRRPDLAAIGAGILGIDEGGGAVPVDDRLRVAPGVWAVGDVTGKGAFTHVAVHQARIAAADILGQDPPAADYRALPRVTFTDPEIGAVGMTEAQARAAGLAVRIGTADVAASARGWIHGPGNAGLVKLVEDERRGVLVGATSAGPAGGEVLGMLALAVHAEVPTATLGRMIYAYPTFHRAIEAAVDDLTG